MRRSTRAFLVSTTLVLLVVVAACGRDPETASGEEAPTPQAGGTLVIGSISDVDSWNEYLSRQSFAGNLLRRIYLRLAQQRPGGHGSPPTYEPMLAESWSFSEDGLALTFRLRDAVWSDGRAIRASDVRFTWQAQTSAEVPWVSNNKQHITDVVVEDERTVTFTFDTRYPYQFDDAVEGGILPEHVFGAVPFDRWVTHDWSGISVGSGPFVLHRHLPGQEIVLKRNDRYYREGYPKLDRIVVRIVPDIGNLVTQVLSGDIDYLETVPADVQALESNSRVNLVSFDYPKYDYLGWNGSRPPFDDQRLRRAMTLAIDREALVEDLLHGFGRVSKGPVLSFSWAADDSLQAWPHDPDEARRILAELGYATRSSEGLTGGGETLEFELITNSGNRLREDVLVKVQEQLSRVGVQARIRLLEMKTLRQKAVSGGYDAYLGGWVFVGKVDLKALFGSSEALNVVAYSSGELDSMLGSLDRSRTFKDMKPALHAIQGRIHEDQPYTFLYETKRVAVHGPRLADVRIDLPGDPLARVEQYRLR